MAYQVCPKCKGSGKYINDLPMTGTILDVGSVAFNGLVKLKEAQGMSNICPVCKGKMIISELTGLPPQE